MEKTELMLKYEQETGETLDMAILADDASGSWYGYIDMVDAKAEAYDRIMSGGKKTLQEYIEKYWDKRVIDFTVRLDGRDSFYIHPASESGDTFNFKAKGNCLETTCECTLPDGREEK